jgi:uncharacterized lipoprotein YmbA
MPEVSSRRAALVLLLALANGCRIIPEPRPEPTRFYTLASPVPPRVHFGVEPLALGLGPIAFPGYLDQSQLVTRLDDERIAFAPADRWAGSLRRQFERALSLRLMAALATDDVATFPWWPGRRIDLAVQLTVLAFETDASGQARLDALWKVRDGKHEQVLEAGQVRVREPIDAGGTQAAVAALDRALGQLADAIAADVRRAGG